MPRDVHRVAQPADPRDSVDAGVRERCDDAARQHADFLPLDRQLDALTTLDTLAALDRSPDEVGAVLVARTHDGPAALALFDSPQAARDFLALALHPACVLELLVRLIRDVHQIECQTGESSNWRMARANA